MICGLPNQQPGKTWDYAWTDLHPLTRSLHALTARFPAGAFLRIGEVLLAFLNPSATIKVPKGKEH
jgi:hypothetical protein